MAPSVDHGVGMLHQRNLEATPANNFDTTSVIVTNSEDVTLSSGAESNGKENRCGLIFYFPFNQLHHFVFVCTFYLYNSVYNCCMY